MAISINGNNFTGEDLARKLKVMWKDNRFIKSLVRQEIILKYAAVQNITVSTEELQESADAFRMRNSLYSVADTEQWLADNGMTLDDLEETILLARLSDKIRNGWLEEEVGKYFAENRVDLETAEVYMLVTEDEAAARELRTQVAEEGADFMVLARKHSSHATARAGGYVGLMRRADLAGEVAAAVFGASQGEVVGPFKTDEGFTLIQVADLWAAALNADTEQSIRNLLFENWLQEQEQKAEVTWAN